MTQDFNSKISLTTYYYFLLLFSLIPISIVAGPTISLINILIIDTSFVILLLIKKDYSFISNKNFKYLILIYIYLIINTLISHDFTASAPRNLGFIRMIILFIAINYFFNFKFFFKKVLLFWSFILFIIIFDIYFEYYHGQNLFGFRGDYGNRVVSFFKDEPIVGGFVGSFFLMLIGFIFNEYKKFKFWIGFFLIIILVSILITGERSNSIKALFGVVVFFLFFKEFSIKSKFLLISVMTILLSTTLIYSDSLKDRYLRQFKVIIFSVEDNHYLRLQKSALEVFYHNKFLGVGNKNYRLNTCLKPNIEKKKYFVKYCTTHPHQIYAEFLSEHGILGFLLLMFIFYKIIFSKIKMTLNSNNYLSIGSLCYLIFIFTPLIPSGAFFSDFNLTLFILNLSIFYGSNQYLNIFSNNK